MNLNLESIIKFFHVEKINYGICISKTPQTVNFVVIQQHIAHQNNIIQAPNHQFALPAPQGINIAAANQNILRGTLQDVNLIATAHLSHGFQVNASFNLRGAKSLSFAKSHSFGSIRLKSAKKFGTGLSTPNENLQQNASILAPNKKETTETLSTIVKSCLTLAISPTGTLLLFCFFFLLPCIQLFKTHNLENLKSCSNDFVTTRNKFGKFNKAYFYPSKYITIDTFNIILVEQQKSDPNLTRGDILVDYIYYRQNAISFLYSFNSMCLLVVLVSNPISNTIFLNILCSCPMPIQNAFKKLSQNIILNLFSRITIFCIYHAVTQKITIFYENRILQPIFLKKKDS